MRVPRFYVPQAFVVGQEFVLSDTTFRHAVQVLRLGAGEPLILFNGEGGEYAAQLSNVSKRSASVLIDSFAAIDTESPIHLTLVQAVIKPDKMDFAMQKAVELGVNTLQPLITQRSVVRASAKSKWIKNCSIGKGLSWRRANNLGVPECPK